MSARTPFVLLAVSLGCTPATTTADAKPATQAVKAAQQATAPSAPATAALGTLGGQPVTLKDLTESQRAALVRHDAKAALDRWSILRNLALEAAGNRALEVGAKAAGVSVDAFRKKMEQEVPLNPVTPEIVQAVFMGNQQHFKGQTLEQVQDVISQQLAQEFKANQAQEIRDRLLERFPFTPTLAPPKLPRMDVDRASAPSLGGKDAKVSVVIFSDFECPYCGRQAQINEALAEHYGERVRWVYRHFPLDFHKFAAEIAVASVCAHDQGKFWGFHDRIFAQRTNFEREGLKGHAKAVGVGDLKAFERCLDDPKKKQVIDEDIAAAERGLVEGTPALFINGQPLYNLVNADALQALINVELQAQGIKPPPPLKTAR